MPFDVDRIGAAVARAGREVQVRDPHTEAHAVDAVVRRLAAQPDAAVDVEAIQDAVEATLALAGLTTVASALRAIPDRSDRASGGAAGRTR